MNNDYLVTYYSIKFLSSAENVSESGYGSTVVALVTLMSGVYRHSQRMIQSAMSDFFGVKISLGTVNRLRKEASVAFVQMRQWIR